MVGSRRPPLLPTTTAAAADTKRKMLEEPSSMDWELMLNAGKIVTKNGWIDGKDSKGLVLICDEAREVLRKQKEKEQQREASHAPQIIPAKDDLSVVQQLEKENAVLQAACNQLLRRLNAQKKHGEQMCRLHCHHHRVT